MKAPRELIAAAKEALACIARQAAQLDPADYKPGKAYTRLAKALDGVRPDDEPEFRSTCPAFLHKYEHRHD